MSFWNELAKATGSADYRDRVAAINLTDGNEGPESFLRVMQDGSGNVVYRIGVNQHISGSEGYANADFTNLADAIAFREAVDLLLDTQKDYDPNGLLATGATAQTSGVAALLGGGWTALANQIVASDISDGTLLGTENTLVDIEQGIDAFIREQSGDEYRVAISRLSSDGQVDGYAYADFSGDGSGVAPEQAEDFRALVNLLLESAAGRELLLADADAKLTDLGLGFTGAGTAGELAEALGEALAEGGTTVFGVLARAVGASNVVNNLGVTDEDLATSIMDGIMTDALSDTFDFAFRANDEDGTYGSSDGLHSGLGDSRFSVGLGDPGENAFAIFETAEQQALFADLVGFDIDRNAAHDSCDVIATEGELVPIPFAFDYVTGAEAELLFT